MVENRDTGMTGVSTPSSVGIPSGEFVKSPLLSSSLIVCPVVVDAWDVDVRSNEAKKNVLFRPLYSLGMYTGPPALPPYHCCEKGCRAIPLQLFCQVLAFQSAFWK